MFYNYRAQSLTALSELFNHHHPGKGSGDPFRSQWIVVQNREMQQWLSLQQATIRGISANNTFIFPSELLWKLYRIIDSELPHQLPSDRNPMHWQIFDLMEQGKLSFLPSVPPDQKNRFRFAAQLADVFDQYQVYRPEMLASWEKGKTVTTFKQAEAWQLKAWNTLKDYWKQSFPQLPDRLEALNRLSHKLKEGSLNDLLPASVTVFGLSHFPKPFGELIGLLSGYMDVRVYSMEYREDSEWSRLQEDWAEMGLENQQILDELVNETESYLEVPDSDGQALILDRPESIELHSCHNERREVEVLKDTLLRKLDQDPDLSLNDILVLVPDMERYTPWIQSVFSSREESEPEIPVFIPNDYQNVVQKAFLVLLDYLTGKATVSSFMDLISSEAVMSKFDLTEESVQKLKAWLSELHIHWGLREEESNYSIEKALYSIITGYLMEPEPFLTWEDLAPLDVLSNSDTAPVLGSLSEILDLLKDTRSRISEKRDAHSWIKLFQSWTLSFFGDMDGDRAGFMQALEKMESGAFFVKKGTGVPYSLMAGWVRGQLSDHSASSNGLGNGLVVSSYIPYRSIPFRLVAILGLNEGVFPRNPVRPDFDLIQKDSLPGDRITKKDDRLLFWEVLKATSGHLHLSYRGQDQRSKQDLLPSVLVQRLTDELKLRKDFELKARTHNLHGFSEDYFDGEQSYSQRNLSVLKANRSSSVRPRPFLDSEITPPDGGDLKEIGLEELISFFTHPSKYFCQNVAGLRYPYQEEELEDREVFALSGLNGYTAKSLSLHGFLDDQEEVVLRRFMKVKGLLPPGIHGDWSLSGVFDEVRQLIQQSGLTDHPEQGAVEIDLQVGDYHMSGVIENIFGDKRVQYRVGSKRAKDLIRLWISHLVLAAAGHPTESELYTIRKGKAERTSLPITAEPKPVLEELAHWFVKAHYHHYHKEALAFVPECSWYYQQEAGKGGAKSAVKKARAAWEGGWYSRGEGTDPYHSLIWSWDELIATKSFSENASCFWDPFLRQLESGGRS